MHIITHPYILKLYKDFLRFLKYDNDDDDDDDDEDDDENDDDDDDVVVVDDRDIEYCPKLTGSQILLNQFKTKSHE